MTLERYQAVAARRERMAFALRCAPDGCPLNASERERIVRKYRRALNGIMRHARANAKRIAASIGR